MASLVRVIKHWQQKRVIARFRAHCEAFGFDTSDLSDDELVDRIAQRTAELGAALKDFGVSAAEAARAWSVVRQ